MANPAEVWVEVRRLLEETPQESPKQPQRTAPWQCSYPGCEHLTRNYIYCDEHTKQ